MGKLERVDATQTRSLVSHFHWRLGVEEKKTSLHIGGCTMGSSPPLAARRLFFFCLLLLVAVPPVNGYGDCMTLGLYSDVARPLLPYIRVHGFLRFLREFFASRTVFLSLFWRE